MSVGAGAVQLRYDPSLPHQAAAVDAVVDLFEDALGGGAEVALSSAAAGRLDAVELGFANPAPRDEAAFEASLLRQLRRVQRRNGLQPSERLDGRHFTVEMETGTGKTYVYLRTIFELHARYGLTKFVIAVPSVAIREGVLTALRSTAEHFRTRYAAPLDHAVYDSRRLGRVRSFAASSTLQVLVMNVQSFQNDTAEGGANVINRPHDALAGLRPIDYVRAVRPVVIVDEPQSFEGAGARAALERLDPLCTLRYSATPRNPYNLVYRLGPVEAFEQRLVKRIEVAGVELDASFDGTHVRLLAVDAARDRARIEFSGGRGEAARLTRAWVRRGDDLAVRSRGRPEYRDGFLVGDIVYGDGEQAIEFTGGTVVALGASAGAEADEVQRMQVRETIRHHLDRELELAPRGIKVLSLFFLDAVADYRVHRADGTYRLGPLGELFERELTAALELPRHAALAGRLGDVRALHGAYFSQDGGGRARDSRGDGEADRSTYETIMRGKERLLSPSEPLRFLFTHSALREGWDNPNVFQVCTLTHARSAITRRQQIGRGLRLPVDRHGVRVSAGDVARLTVIANESYDAFARGLQVDYEREAGATWEEGGVAVPPVRDARRAVAVTVRERLLDDAGFRAFWDDVARRTRFSVRVDGERLAAEAIRRIGEMDEIRRPVVRSERALLSLSGAGISVEAGGGAAVASGGAAAARAAGPERLPDMLGELRDATDLTRATLVRILGGCGRLDELALNPHAFTVAVTRIVRDLLREQLVERVAYEPVRGGWRVGRLADAGCAAPSHSADRSYAVRNEDKSPHSHVAWSSPAEEAFVRALDGDERVRWFVRLPEWFAVDTPVGPYNPGWAICWQDGGRWRHLVRETSGTANTAKTVCGGRHFAALGVDHGVVAGFGELAAQMRSAA